MFWVCVTILLSVFVICGCIEECAEAKYEADTCCCKDCPYKGVCEGCDRE